MENSSDTIDFTIAFTPKHPWPSLVGHRRRLWHRGPLRRPNRQQVRGHRVGIDLFLKRQKFGRTFPTRADDPLVGFVDDKKHGG